MCLDQRALLPSSLEKRLFESLGILRSVESTGTLYVTVGTLGLGGSSAQQPLRYLLSSVLVAAFLSKMCVHISYSSHHCKHSSKQSIPIYVGTHSRLLSPTPSAGNAPSCTVTVTHVHHSARPTAHRLPSTTSIQSFTPSATPPSTNTLSKPAQGIHRRDSRQGVISNGVRAHETFLHPPPITHVPQRRECPCLHTIAQFTIMAVSSQARNQSAAVVDRNKRRRR